MNFDAKIILYAEDFDTDVWEDYCDICGLSPNNTMIIIKCCSENISGEEEAEDTCYGETIEEVLQIAREYQEINGREFDEEWARNNIIELGTDRFVLHNYSDAWK